MVEFTIYKDLEKVNANSLLIDSGEEVASLQVEKFYLSLMCYGEVRVNYGEETFFRASDYPQIITDFLLGKVKEEDLEKEFWVGDNNWFQAELYIIGENKSLKSVSRVNDYADVFDIEGCLKHTELSLSEMLYRILLGYLKDLKRDYGEEVEELKDLDLTNL